MWNGQPLDRALDVHAGEVRRGGAAPPRDPRGARRGRMGDGEAHRGGAGDADQGPAGRGGAAGLLRAVHRLGGAETDRQHLVRGLRRELEGRSPPRRGGEALGALPRRPHAQAGGAARAFPPGR